MLQRMVQRRSASCTSADANLVLGVRLRVLLWMPPLCTVTAVTLADPLRQAACPTTPSGTLRARGRRQSRQPDRFVQLFMRISTCARTRASAPLHTRLDHARRRACGSRW
eukprot:scaffold55672_cov34-Phaeocystis_antarctica.AAC.1